MRPRVLFVGKRALWPASHRARIRVKPSLDAVAILQSASVVDGLPAKELQALGAAAHVERLRAREYVFREGDAALWFCIVVARRVSGRCSLRRPAA